MNTARVIALLRELADAFEAPEQEPGAPVRGRRRRERAIPEPSRPVDELARRRVSETLREKGWRE